MDDTAPTISSATGINLVENSGANQTVCEIIATDDIGVSSYAISGTDAGLLSVNSSTGVVSLTANPNYETKPSYSFTVTASDAAGNASTATNVTFSITNVNDVGDFYQGGVIYYIFNSQDNGYVSGEIHGLIAAVENQGSEITWSISDDAGNNVTTGATGMAIGTGSANTDAIIAVQGTASSHAAGLARAYAGGSYTDWFLPSKYELNKMYLNKATINSTATANGGSNFSDDGYWSSTEHSYVYAWYYDFDWNVSGIARKETTYEANKVRAVRAF